MMMGHVDQIFLANRLRLLDETPDRGRNLVFDFLELFATTTANVVSGTRSKTNLRAAARCSMVPAPSWTDTPCGAGTRRLCS